MITDAEVERVPGATVYGADGEKIGKAGVVYRDDQSGRPDWMTVQTGLFGGSESFVPLAQASFDGEDLTVPFDKAQVKDAPRVDATGHLDISEEDRLFEHYGLAGAQGPDNSTDNITDRRDDERPRHAADTAPDQVSSARDAAPERSTDAGTATAERRPRLTQWVLVERTSIIEVSPEEAERLTGARTDVQR